MPLYHKKEFEPQRVPDGLKPDDKVFFLPLTKEVFTSYDAFFHRLVALNSLVWTCSVTGKAGLTFEEALKSEKDAQETLESFPEYLETPILYLVKEYTMRGRLDDVVNDIYDFMRNRFFVGEEVSYFGEGRRKRVRILSVSYSGPEFTTSTFPGTNSVPNEKTKKRGELLIGESKNYSYTVQIIDADGGESDSGVREHVENDQLLRPKSSSSRAKLKLLLKNSCFLDTNRINVKKSLVTSNQLESVRWTDIFGGPMAVFPQTPAASRSRNNTAKTVTKETLSNNELDEVLVQNANGETASENTTPTKKKRGRPKGSTSSAKKEGDETNTTLPEDPEEKRRRKIEEKVDKKMKKIEKERLVKQKKEIAKQQEELQSLFQKARRIGVADVSAWEQKEKLLSAEDIAELRQAIKTAREQERERIRLQKQKEREAYAEWKKARDDLQCDDLKPLPDYPPLPIAPWMSDEDFADFLLVYQFFQNFADILPIQEVRGSPRVTFEEVVVAVRSSDPQSAFFVELMHVLLQAKSELADEEDGDEANLRNRDEIGWDTNIDLENKLFGPRVREATFFHETQRLTHGVSPRHLPIDWMTITEVIRLLLLTSGYYTGVSTHRFKLFSRGSYRCYDDEGFIFVNSHPETMEKLEKGTIFDLEPSERLKLMKVVIQQILSYCKMRVITETRMNEISELRRELKTLRIFDAAQDKEAKDARNIREYEMEQVEENGEAARIDLIKRCDPSKDTVKLRCFLRTFGEGVASRREEKLAAEVHDLILSNIAYNELELDEITKVRELQKERVGVKEDEILRKIYRQQAGMGWNFLGRDRAFRKYWFIESLSLLLVELPTLNDECGYCYEPTPLDKVDETFRAECSDRELRLHLLACTDNTDCPAHRLQSQSRWHYVDSPDMLEQIVYACNLRGLRESELAENLNFLKTGLNDLLERSARRMEHGEHTKDLMVKRSDPAERTVFFDWAREMSEMLLDLEERVENGGIGHLPSYINRDEWRRSVMQDNNVVAFVKEDIQVDDEVIISVENLHSLSTAQNLAVAFYQIVQGISMNFFREPFVTSCSRDAQIVQREPTETFYRWQKGLLESKSIPALALFYTTLESGIQWSRSLLQAKCRTCRKRGVGENLVLCRVCNRCYHIDCVRPKLAKVVDDWICADCRAVHKASEAKKRRDFQTDSFVKVENDSSDRSTKEEEEGTEESSSVYEDEASSTDDTYDTPPVMQKTASGRVVKKVVYTENVVESNPRRKSRKPLRGRYENFETDDLDSYSNRNLSKKRKKLDDGGHVLRSLSMGLRESGHETRDAMRQFEALIRDAMKQPSAWPFILPVDAREVPDYYTIIKRPMDLRTMMNKLKQQLYDEPDQVVADARLMFDNCRVYNEEGSEIIQCADKLEQYMEQRFDSMKKNSNAIVNGRSSRRYCE